MWMEPKRIGRPPKPAVITVDDYVIDEAGCWNWTATKPDAEGYIRLTRGRRRYWAHRLSYEQHVGPIPEGLVIDHLCRNHGCVNPDHLEPVTSRTNVVVRGFNVTADNARLTHCRRGHPLSGENLHILNSGSRVCRICTSATHKAKREGWTLDTALRWAEGRGNQPRGSGMWRKAA